MERESIHISKFPLKVPKLRSQSFRWSLKYLKETHNKCFDKYCNILVKDNLTLQTVKSDNLKTILSFSFAITNNYKTIINSCSYLY